MLNEKNIDAIRILSLSMPTTCEFVDQLHDVVRQSHYLDIESRRLDNAGVNEAEVICAACTVESHFKHTSTYFDTRINQAIQRIAMLGGDESRPYVNFKRFEICCPTKIAADFVVLLQQADRYLRLLEYMWIQQWLIDSSIESLKVRLQAFTDTHNLLKAFSLAIKLQSQRVRKQDKLARA